MHQGTPHSEVEVVVPAEGAYVSVVRMTTAGLAARLDFTLDDIEDLRIAVGEACSIALEFAGPDARLRCDFDLADARLVVTVRVATELTEVPNPDGLGWAMLHTLAHHADASVDDGVLRIEVTMKSSVSV